MHTFPHGMQRSCLTGLVHRSNDLIERNTGFAYATHRHRRRVYRFHGRDGVSLYAGNLVPARPADRRSIPDDVPWQISAAPQRRVPRMRPSVQPARRH